MKEEANPNIFTPPASCLDKIYTASPGGDFLTMTTYAIYIGSVALTLLIEGSVTLEHSCYPKGFGYTTSSTYSGGHVDYNATTVLSKLPLSPTTCPSGYENLSQQVSKQSTWLTPDRTITPTTATCCPRFVTPHAV